jgi:hypothetical protein
MAMPLLIDRFIIVKIFFSTWQIIKYKNLIILLNIESFVAILEISDLSFFIAI